MFDNRKEKVKTGGSFSRLMALTKKNLLRFYKNPKGMAFLLLIPIMYYIIIGLIFGGVGDYVGNYNLGWVDDDPTTADYSLNPYYNVNELYTLINNIDNITVKEYDSKEVATNAALKEEIDAFVYFPYGFEASLEERAFTQIGFWDNDSTSSSLYPLLSMYFSLEAQTASIFKLYNLTGTNYITGTDQINVTTFQNSILDSILIVNKNYGQGLDNNWNVNMTYMYRSGLSIAKLDYTTGILSGIINGHYKSAGASSNITIFSDYIIGTSLKDPVSYEIYFLQSLNPTTKNILKSLIDNIITGVINYNPNEIDLQLIVGSAVGSEVNQLTYQASGLLLYGPMTILSYAIIILTSEKKNGIYKRLASSEVRNYEIVLSSIIADIILIFMQFAIGMAIIIPFGWNPIIASPIDAIFGVILTIFLFSFFILALAFALTPVFKDPDTAGGGVWIILIPMMMLSGIFFPIELMGESMQVIAGFFPTRYAVLIFQDLLLDGLPLTEPAILINMGILGLYSLGLFIVGILAFRKFKK